MMNRVLCIDPGKMTGLAFWDGSKAVIHEFDFGPAADAIEHLCAAYRSSLSILWERFDIRPDTHKKTADAHHAIEMIGVARHLARRYRVPVLTAAAPGDRLVATQSMLEELGWWMPGYGDAQSAAQHLLAYMMRSGNQMPTEVRSVISARLSG